ncbi:MAG: DUF4339 domain-containing protein [Thermoguttaceae bacterium]|jgi:hypothetical protein
MADQWYYTEQGQRKGPVSEDDLKQLASTGRIKPADLVWKQGMAAWGPASQVAGLIFPPVEDGPPPIPPEDEPPPIPPETARRRVSGAAVSIAAQEMGASVASSFRTVGRLLSKRIERATLVRRTIPRAYQALGKHIYSMGSYRSDFPEVYVRLDGLLAEIAVLEARPKAQAVGAILHASKAMLPVAVLKRRATLAFRELGSVALAKYPELSGAEDALRPLVEARNRLSGLEKEIASLSHTQRGQKQANDE